MRAFVIMRQKQLAFQARDLNRMMLGMNNSHERDIRDSVREAPADLHQRVLADDVEGGHSLRNNRSISSEKRVSMPSTDLSKMMCFLNCFQQTEVPNRSTTSSPH